MGDEKEILEEIQQTAAIYKIRAKRSSSGGERHDRILDDEAEAMSRLKQRYDLPDLKIASEFNRDPRSVENALKKYENKELNSKAKADVKEKTVEVKLGTQEFFDIDLLSNTVYIESIRIDQIILADFGFGYVIPGKIPNLNTTLMVIICQRTRY